MPSEKAHFQKLRACLLEKGGCKQQSNFWIFFYIFLPFPQCAMWDKDGNVVIINTNI